MARKNRGKSPETGRIRQGGMLQPAAARIPDVVLQMPEIFFFDMGVYQRAVTAASSIDFSNRVRLYDMYESARLDLHLSGIIDKRLRGVTKIPIEFQRDGKTDETISAQLRSPWFKQLRKDLIMSQFWGYTLVQFYTDDEGNIRYDLINRKHYDPIHRKLLKFQGDVDGISIDEFPDTLFVGRERDLGIFAEILPAVLYKRGDMADWARFCNVFGMPIREYTYDAGDEEARRRLIAEARRQGTNAVYIHPKDSELRLLEAANKSGTSELYKTFAEYFDAKMSIRVLGNTLTTETKDTGTQALGTVHKQEEDSMHDDDRDFILDILNYDMRPVFASLGFNVEGGEFVYAHKDKISPSQQIDIVQKLSSMGLPIDDDYLYETFGVAKPKDYEQQKAEKAAQREALHRQLNPDDPQATANADGGKGPGTPPNHGGPSARLSRFFGLAPSPHGAPSE